MGWFQRGAWRAVVAVVWLACLPLGGDAKADDAPVAEPYAWYRGDGIRHRGADVFAWENAAGDPARSLTRIVGRPRVVRVRTPTGPRNILRLEGGSAIWQAVSQWGTLAGDRTIIVFARIPPGGRGVLLDGSTRPGSSPVAWDAGGWKTTAESTGIDALGGWRMHAFVFRGAQPPLGGLILGANVATGEPLSCDLGEVVVVPRPLDRDEVKVMAARLAEAWGEAADLPAAEQPGTTEPPADPRVFRTTVRSRGDDGVHTYRIPALATTVKGTLVAVFDARNKGSGDLPADIDVAMMRSTDDGGTWSPMRRIIDFDAGLPGAAGNGVGDPAILVDRDRGRIIVAALWSKGRRAWHGSGPGLTPDETGQLVLVHSDDDGLNWSPPRSITPQVKRPEWRLCFNGPGNGIQLRDGALVFPAQFKEPGPGTGVPHSCFIASRDGGETWAISPPAIPAGPPTSESAIAELADGSLLLSMRDESRSGARAWARWDRQENLLAGRWSAPWSAVPDPTCMASLIRHPHGELILANPADPARRVALTIRSSADGGRTWSAGRLLDPGPAMYSSLSVLRDGRLGLLYEQGDAARLVFARFPLEWVLEGASDPTVPEPRTETTGKFGWWPARHAAKVAETRAGGIELMFIGDSITQGWETTGADAWAALVAGRRAANYGFGGDSTQHVLWRLENGELDGLAPRCIVLLVGTNNVRHGDFTPEQIAAGIGRILGLIANKCPDTRVLLLGILPRGATAADPLRRKCAAVNALLPALADGNRVRYLDVGSRLLTADGVLTTDVAPDLLHLSQKGYRLLAAEIGPALGTLLGDP